MIIDMHGHWTSSGLRDYLAGAVSLRNVSDSVKPLSGLDDTNNQNLKCMEDRGIDLQVLSIRPVSMLHVENRYISIPWARVHNNVMAEAISRHPDRFRGLATLPQGAEMDAWVDELERAVKELGMVGAIVNPNPKGDESTAPLDDPFWLPLWEKAIELDVPLFLHGAYLTGGRYLRNRTAYLVGQTVEETIAGPTLVYGGVVEKLPALKLILCHGGGANPLPDRALPHAPRPRRGPACSAPSTTARSWTASASSTSTAPFTPRTPSSSSSRSSAPTASSSAPRPPDAEPSSGRDACSTTSAQPSRRSSGLSPGREAADLRGQRQEGLQHLDPRVSNPSQSRASGPHARSRRARPGCVKAERGTAWQPNARPPLRCLRSSTRTSSPGSGDILLPGSDKLSGVIKRYDAGGENVMHCHPAEDHAFYILDGQATFHIERDEKRCPRQPVRRRVLAEGVVVLVPQLQATRKLIMLRTGSEQGSDRLIGGTYRAQPSHGPRR